MYIYNIIYFIFDDEFLIITPIFTVVPEVWEAENITNMLFSEWTSCFCIYNVYLKKKKSLQSKCFLLGCA